MVIKVSILMKPSSCDTFYSKAMYIAQKSTMRQKHGCVIVYNNKEIIAEGYNHIRNNNMEHLHSIHAEMEAIKKLKQIIKNKDKNFINKCKLYVVRIGTGTYEAPLKQSSPCPHCTKAIIDVGIQRVCYSVDDSSFEEEYICKLTYNYNSNYKCIKQPDTSNIRSMSRSRSRSRHTSP
jgi:deoxycytidylate deaminase